MLLSGSPPFSGANDQEILSRIRTGKFSMEGRRWKHVSERAKSFIRTLLVPVENRPTAQQALEHVWLEKHMHRRFSVDENNSLFRPLDMKLFSDLKQFSEQIAFKRAVDFFLGVCVCVC